ncbi:MAG: hypothetical protein JWO19_4504 [Bryobacterales bacterium]|nr:hypothetical protein [Bryobacterales bacterium]
MRRHLYHLRVSLQARCRAALRASNVAHLMFFTGLGSIVVGAGLVYKPLGYLSAGLIMVWVSFLLAADAKG